MGYNGESILEFEALLRDDGSAFRKPLIQPKEDLAVLPYSSGAVSLNVYGVFKLPDTETNTENNEKRAVWNCVEGYILHRDSHQHRFPLSSDVIYWCQSRCRAM